MDAPIAAIVGPTASGKTELALTLAQAAPELGFMGAEIINADAFQLYRGMDIGTAKPDQNERNLAPHHLFDVLDIDQVASVAAYQKQARALITQVRSRGALPILVGGSGLYLRAVLDCIDFPGTDPLVRESLEEQYRVAGVSAAYQRLAQLDPLAAERIEPNNLRRIVRALEVIEITGKPFSANLPSYQYFQPAIQFGISFSVPDLAERIEARTQKMFADGFVQEVAALAEAGLAETKTASKATGYAQVLSYLQGQIDLEEAIAATALATRQLAARQRKWFRRDPRINWLEPAEITELPRRYQTIARQLSSGPEL